jgi:hypothetical protein
LYAPIKLILPFYSINRKGEEHMLVKKITYTDYNGEEHTEKFYFNLTKAEILEMEISKNGGYQEYLKRLVNTRDQEEIAGIFKKFILKSYGIKSDDGKRFIKSEELSKEFEQTEAYSELYWELITDTAKAAEFFDGLMPKALVVELEKDMKAKGFNSKEEYAQSILDED